MLKRKNISIIFIFSIFGGALYFFKSSKPEVSSQTFSSLTPVNESTHNQKFDSNNQANKAVAPVIPNGPRSDDNSRQEQSYYRTLEDLKKDFGPGWAIMMGESNDKSSVKTILVENAHQPVLDDEKALEFANKLRPLLGVENAELSLKKDAKVPAAIDIVQSIKGYEVYDSRLRFILDQESSVPLMINNSLKDIAFLNDRVSIDAETAKSIVLQKIVSPALPMKISIKEKPVAYFVAGSESVLAWVVHVEWIANKLMNSQDVLIQTVDGRILFQRNLVYR